jgi:hypothetical protein
MDKHQCRSDAARENHAVDKFFVCVHDKCAENSSLMSVCMVHSLLKKT